MSLQYTWHQSVVTTSDDKTLPTERKDISNFSSGGHAVWLSCCVNAIIRQHPKKKGNMTRRRQALVAWHQEVQRQKESCGVVTWVYCHVALHILFGSPACDHVIRDALDFARQACRQERTVMSQFILNLPWPWKTQQHKARLKANSKQMTNCCDKTSFKVLEHYFILY